MGVFAHEESRGEEKYVSLLFSEEAGERGRGDSEAQLLYDESVSEYCSDCELISEDVRESDRCCSDSSLAVTKSDSGNTGAESLE